MARIAIFSDIHGNLEAFEAVLNALEAERVDHLVHLGDLVGYNANPHECLQLMQERRISSVLGNHDLAILEPRYAEGFNVLAYQALHYSERQLTSSDRGYLQGLPRSDILLGHYLLCHGTPENVESYILHVFQAKRVFNFLQKKHPGIRVCFYGHTHKQRAWIRDERGKVFSPNATPSSLLMEDGRRYLVNPGSVGQPRQGDKRAHYLVFDADSGIIHFRAVPYDIGKAQKKILEAGLPEYLALRLDEGI
jgi:predicted phosphodiesterase